MWSRAKLSLKNHITNQTFGFLSRIYEQPHLKIQTNDMVNAVFSSLTLGFIEVVLKVSSLKKKIISKYKQT